MGFSCGHAPLPFERLPEAEERALAEAELPTLLERERLGILTPSQVEHIAYVRATGRYHRWGRRCIFWRLCKPDGSYQQVTDHDPADRWNHPDVLVGNAAILD